MVEAVVVGPVIPQRAGPEGPDRIFVGRSGELHALRVNLGWAGAGEPRVVEVTGPSGIGKSALARAFLAQAGPTVRSLSGYGTQAEAGTPFGVLKQLQQGTELAGRALDGNSESRSAGALFVDLLGILEDTGPVVVMVDDVQWADAPSMQALTFALRRLHADRVMALIVRDDGYPDLPDSVRQLVEARGDCLRLGGLDAVALAELAVRKGAGRLPVTVAERFRQHTSGHPLLATALLEQAESADLREAASLGPSSYASVVVSRLAACTPSTKALVAAAAVLGEHCSLPTATRLAGLDDASSALKEAVSVHLLEGDDPGGRLIGFGHPLTRAAVYDGLDPGRRMALHARAATVIAGDAALDHRVTASPGADADLAAELADRAASEAAGGFWVVAAGHFESAAHFDPDASRRERFLLDAGYHYLRGGEQAKAAELAGAVTTDSPKAWHLRGLLALESGRLEEAGGFLERAWEGAPDLGAPLATQLGQLALNQARAEEAVAWGHRALASAGDAGDARSSARWVVALGLAFDGRGVEALPLFEHSPAKAWGGKPADLDGVLLRGAVRSLTEDLAAAGHDLAAVSSAGAGGNLRVRIYGLAFLARTEYLLGRWDASVGHADTATSLAEDADHFRALVFCRFVATMALAARGEWEPAVAHAEALASAAAQSGSALDRAWAAGAAAQVAFARADPVGIVAAIEPAIDLWSRDGFQEPTLLAWREQYSDALVSLGRLDEAASILAELAATAWALGRRSSLAGAARVGGRLQAARGNVEVAESAFEDALVHLEGMPAPFHRALVEEAHGRHLRRQAQPRAAAAHLRTARATFADLGARPFLERCDRELVACGFSPDRPEASPVSLTPQELAAARLAALGYSNREVATELVVSAKTAEIRLHQVYDKLGTSSPQRLAAALAGRNLG